MTNYCTGIMFRHLDGYWIITSGGILIDKKPKILNVDDQCLGGLISALYTFTKTGFNETLSRFTTDKYQYYIIKFQKILFAGRFPSNKSIREADALKELKKIKNKFFKKYSVEELKEWDHDMTKFADFGNEIKTNNELLGEYAERLWDHGVSKNPV